MGGNFQGEKLALKERVNRRGKVLIIILTDFFLQASCQVTHRTRPKSLAINLALLKYVNKTFTF